MSARPVYLVDGVRTPFLKARGRRGPFTPVDLAVHCAQALLLRQPIPLEAIDAVILGCVNVIAEEMNPARVAALRLGLERASAFTVQINCGSGMQSIDTAGHAIESGRRELVLAGGTEALSHAPLMVRERAVDWLARVRAARGIAARLARLAELRPSFLLPVVGLERGLTDPIVDLGMGQTAEELAHLFGIERTAADAYAAESHRRLARAQAEGWLEDEIVPLIDRDGALYEHDDGVRADTTEARLAALPGAFEPPHGQVTAGNSSQITDGASWVLLASEPACERFDLAPRARIVDSAWSVLDPAIMGLAPTLCAGALLERHELGLGDVDLWELNEAFAHQVLACLAAWEDPGYCRSVLGLADALGPVDRERLNIDGGAIGLGHPVGTSGNRIVHHLVGALERLGARRGVATECIGGGQGGAMLVERL